MTAEIEPVFYWVASGLGLAITALAGYVVKLNSMDRRDRRETHGEMVSLVKQSTEVNTALKAAVEANTKTTDVLHRAMSDYMRPER